MLKPLHSNIADIHFELGDPSKILLQQLDLRSALDALLISGDVPHLEYASEQGVINLINDITHQMSDQGIKLQIDNLLITQGITHGLDIIAKLHTGIVIVENPTYRDAISVFRDYGRTMVTVEIDEDGIIPQSLEVTAKELPTRHPLLLYTIPTFHNPTGSTIPNERRLSILKIAQDYNITIVEDNAYSEIAFEKKQPDSFYKLSELIPSRVISLYSLSKTLAPGFRIGWMVGPSSIIADYVAVGTFRMGGGANPLSSYLVSSILRDVSYRSMLDNVRTHYEQKRDVMLSSLEENMPEKVTWSVPNGGFFIWLTLPDDINAEVISKIAKKKGIHVAEGSDFFLNPTPEVQNHIRLAFSYEETRKIRDGISELSKIIKGVVRNYGRP